VKRSSTPTPENDEEYENREINYEAERQAHQRHMGKDLIWRTSMQRQEYNLNQRRRQLDVRKAHLHVCERRCDHREAEIHATRMRGTDMESESGSEYKYVSFILIKKYVRFSLDTTKLLIKCPVLHATI
jgi:hypothetical protein